MKVLDLEMPLCSINERYTARIVKGKPILLLSNKYRKCKEDVAKCAVGGNIKNASVVKIWINTYKDIDATCKLILDSLQEKGIIDNDSQILELHIYKTVGKKGKDDKIKVEVY